MSIGLLHISPAISDNHQLGRHINARYAISRMLCWTLSRDAAKTSRSQPFSWEINLPNRFFCSLRTASWIFEHVISFPIHMLVGRRRCGPRSGKQWHFSSINTTRWMSSVRENWNRNVPAFFQLDDGAPWCISCFVVVNFNPLMVLSAFFWSAHVGRCSHGIYAIGRSIEYEIYREPLAA